MKYHIFLHLTNPFSKSSDAHSGFSIAWMLGSTSWSTWVYAQYTCVVWVELANGMIKLIVLKLNYYELVLECFNLINIVISTWVARSNGFSEPCPYPDDSSTFDHYVFHCSFFVNQIINILRVLHIYNNREYTLLGVRYILPPIPIVVWKFDDLI